MALIMLAARCVVGAEVLRGTAAATTGGHRGPPVTLFPLQSHAVPREVLIAIVVGGAGAVLGLLAFLIAIVASVAATRAGKTAESVAQEVKQSEASGWMRDQELESSLKVRQRALGVIQKVKDEVDAVLRGTSDSADREALTQNVSAAGRAVAALLGEIQGQLTQAEQVALIRAREAALELSARVREALQGIDDPAQLPVEVRREIRLLRADLTEAQLAFRDSLMARVLKRLIERRES
jgi:hypothetical protein